MLKVNVKHFNLFLKLMQEAVDAQDFKKATRYWLLAIHELRRQRHISKADLIHQRMQRLMFKIEIDDAFQTTQDVNN